MNRAVIVIPAMDPDMRTQAQWLTDALVKVGQFSDVLVILMLQ